MKKYNYQVIVIGTLNQSTEGIIKLLFHEIKNLKLPIDSYKIIYANDFKTDYTGNQPTYVLYFGNSEGIHEDLKILEYLINDGNVVLPIFYDSFKKEIPKLLANQNGLKYDDTKDIKIVNLILESFGKLRTSRKVFISYKRDQSSSVAIQLYEALENNNYDVFLDTHSIKQGEPFQDELWHRMTDCDVIVLLNTSKFLDSEWCSKELAESSAKKIGVIQLIWPDHSLERMAEICFPTQLYASDFVANDFDDKNSRLIDNTVSKIVQHVESVRARNLASRQDDIITEFLNIARKYKKKVNVQPERFITEELEDEKRRIFIPSVGIPQSIDCEQSSELKKEIKDYSIDEIYLIYDDLRIREKWLRHLDYLNLHLDVKTIKKQEFDLWLQKN